MALVRYDPRAFLRMHDENFGSGGVEKTETCSAELSGRLHALLERAREANEASEQQEPLEDFLSRHQQEREKDWEACERQIKISVSALTSTMESNLRLDGSSVSQATQTELDREHVEKLLPARREQEVKWSETKGGDPFQSLLGPAARK